MSRYYFGFVTIVIFGLMLMSCGGGGSSVTAVSLEADRTQLAPGERAMLIATEVQALPESDPYWDRVKFSFRTNNSGASLDVIDRRLDGNLQARAVYIAGDNPGIDVVEVSFESGAKAIVTITVGHPVTSVSLTAESTVLLPSARTELVASAQYDFPPDFPEAVNFSFRTNNSGAYLDVIDERLDGNDEARAIYIAGSEPGIDVVEVSFASGARATVTITVGYGVSRIRLEQFGWDIRATALNALDMPVPDAELDFVITAGEIESSATTNQNGVVEVSFTLPPEVNTARVTASSGTVSATLDVVRTTLTRSITTTSDQVGGTSYIVSSIRMEHLEDAVQVIMSGEDGTSVVGVPVFFYIDGDLLDKGLITTDEDGRVLLKLSVDDLTDKQIKAEAAGLSASFFVKIIDLID
ncbi:Ig-like domain-containing protein [Desulfonatronovibrio magnus]|uniref:Ig-like domain-containing protein n=1 Tax=Desulfonatronovibrio magnus TaxID=698827 RepID=UPI0005EB9F12|nr:Ig-like domain-containing protein [Desulfonatronovibrio magnus]